MFSYSSEQIAAAAAQLQQQELQDEDMPEVFDLSKLQSDSSASAGGLQLDGVSPSLWSAVFSSQNMPGKGRATASSAAQGYPVAEGAAGPAPAQQELQQLAGELAGELQLESLLSDASSDGCSSGRSSSGGHASSSDGGGGGFWRRQAPPTPEAARLQALQHLRTLVQADTTVAVAEAEEGAPAGAGQQQQDLHAVQLRSIDLDRQAAVNGVLPEGVAKRLCVRWLDELIIALWHDLQVRPGRPAGVAGGGCGACRCGAAGGRRPGALAGAHLAGAALPGCAAVHARRRGPTATHPLHPPHTQHTRPPLHCLHPPLRRSATWSGSSWTRSWWRPRA